MMIQFEKITTRESRTGAHANSLASAPNSTRSNSNVIDLRQPGRVLRGFTCSPLIASDGGLSDRRNETAPIFKRSEFTQAFLDALAIIFAFLFVTVTGLGISAAIFILLFVNL